MLQRRLTSSLISSSLRTNYKCAPRRGFASATPSPVEAEGNVLTHSTDYEFWKLSTKSNEEKIRDYSVDYPGSGRGITEDFFGFPESRLGKPLVAGTKRTDNTWAERWLNSGDVRGALAALDKEKPRLHNYELLAYGLIGHEATSAEVTAVLEHARAKAPLTTTFLGQIMEAYVNAKDFEAALHLFESVESAYKLPVTLELQHKFLGLFQLNPEYEAKVEEVRTKFLEGLSKARSYGQASTAELPESDPLAQDHLLSVPAEQEQKILRSFLSGVSVTTPFEQGIKEWKRRLDSYISWHQAEEKAALDTLKRDHASLLEKYQRRNSQVTAYLQKRVSHVQ